MTAAKSLAMALAELRAQARVRQRRAPRVFEAAPLLIRLLSACHTLAVEERTQGLAFRLVGETEQNAVFKLTCILPAAQDAVKLTTAERAVVELLCEGFTQSQIARQRGVSANTVKSQVRQVFRKFNVESRVALVRRWCP